MLTSFSLVIVKCRPDEDFCFEGVMHPLPNTIEKLRIGKKSDIYSTRIFVRREEMTRPPSSSAHLILTRRVWT